MPFARVKKSDKVATEETFEKMCAERKMLRKVVAELKRTTDFLEGISILTGPCAAAFTDQQNRQVNRARKVIALAKKR